MSCHIYPMSMSLHNHSDLEHIEVEFTPEQTEVLVQAAAGRQRAPALEPLPIETLTDPLPWSLHQATSHGNSKASVRSNGFLISMAALSAEGARSSPTSAGLGSTFWAT